MSYLSQIILDRAEVAKRNLHGLYDWHELSWRLFPEKKKNDKRDFLTRLDVFENEFKFTILSLNRPTIPVWCPPEHWKEMAVPGSFFERDRYYFKLLANPTKTLSKRGPKGNKKENGSHYAITASADLQEWLVRHGEKNGLCILEQPEIEISPPVLHKLHRRKDEGVLIGVEFKGAIKITERLKFIKAAHEGIGRARGFGFGMLVLKPIS